MIIQLSALIRYAHNHGYAVIDTREYGKCLYHYYAKDSERMAREFGVLVLSNNDFISCDECGISMFLHKEQKPLTRATVSPMYETLWGYRYVKGKRVPICAECYRQA